MPKMAELTSFLCVHPTVVLSQGGVKLKTACIHCALNWPQQKQLSIPNNPFSQKSWQQIIVFEACILCFKVILLLFKNHIPSLLLAVVQSLSNWKKKNMFMAACLEERDRARTHKKRTNERTIIIYNSKLVVWCFFFSFITLRLLKNVLQYVFIKCFIQYILPGSKCQRPTFVWVLSCCFKLKIRNWTT